MDVYALRPVNKTAGFVTSQSGCSNTFLLSEKEQLKIIKQRKHFLQEQAREIRARIGIDGGREGNGKYPRHILKHPEYKIYIGIKAKLTELEAELYELNKKVKKITLPERSFENRFVDVAKEKYPEIYEAIKLIITSTTTRTEG